MRQIKTTEAVGHVLCHDMTQIIKDQYKDARFRKGHIVTEADIPILLSMGKENLYVWEVKPGILHENDAAERLVALCKNNYMASSAVKEGKIELTAEIDGLFRVDSKRLIYVNHIDEIMIATRHGNTPVRKGDKLCGTRVIPLVIEEAKIQTAEAIAGKKPLLELLPFKLKKAAVITTGSEVFHGRIKDAFTPVVQKKLHRYGIEMTEQTNVDDGPENIESAIQSMRKKKH